MKARRLAVIATWINENVPGLRAEMERGYCNTDRHLSGTRLCWPGKGRRGTRIKVYDTTKVTPHGHPVVLDHNAAETYRCNSEVEEWLTRWLEEHPTERLKTRRLARKP